MKNFAKKVREKLGGRRFSKGVMLAVVLVFFLIGYNTVTSIERTCYAQNTIPDPQDVTINSGNCFTSTGQTCAATIVLCDYYGMGATIRNLVYQAFFRLLKQRVLAYEKFFANMVDDVVESVLYRIHKLETDMVSWWEIYMHYNLLPGLKAFTRQLDVVADATDEMKTAFVNAGLTSDKAGSGNGAAGGGGGLTQSNTESRMRLQVDDVSCPVATASGGLTRSFTMAKTVRRAQQYDSIGRGTNRRGSVGAKGTGAVTRYEADVYKNYFCNPADNGGHNNCQATDPTYYNADVKPVYDTLTTPKTEAGQLAVEQATKNMVGSTKADPMILGAMETTAGQDKWLQRRAFLAKHAALASVPRLISSWRTPSAGTSVGNWLKELRQGGSGTAPILPSSELSDDPSYKEIMYTLSVERMNSGSYANGTVTNETAQNIEKIELDSFYLMQLRDYFDLLERTALTLAVQVSMMAEEIPVPPAEARSK